MGVCLCRIETIIRNQYFFTNFVFECSEEDDTKKTYPVIDPLFMVNTMVQILTP